MILRELLKSGHLHGDTLTWTGRTLAEEIADAHDPDGKVVRRFEDEFQLHGLLAAQVLLTHDDLSDRQRYLNARSTLLTLLDFGVVPVINENDTVVVDEIRFGDNDRLAARVAQAAGVGELLYGPVGRHVQREFPTRFSIPFCRITGGLDDIGR